MKVVAPLPLIIVQDELLLIPVQIAHAVPTHPDDITCSNNYSLQYIIINHSRVVPLFCAHPLMPLPNSTPLAGVYFIRSKIIQSLLAIPTV
jgi:hypothetical protein